MTGAGWMRQKRDIGTANLVMKTCCWLVNWRAPFTDLRLPSNSSPLVVFSSLPQLCPVTIAYQLVFIVALYIFCDNSQTVISESELHNDCL